MKTTGIIRRVDDLGRVVIPKEVRQVMGFDRDEPLEIFPDPENGQVVLKKYDVTKPITQVVDHLRRLIINDGQMKCLPDLLSKVAEIEALLRAERNENERMD